MWALLAAFLAFQTDFTADGLKALDEQGYTFVTVTQLLGQRVIYR